MTWSRPFASLALLVTACLCALDLRAQTPVVITVSNSPGSQVPEDFVGLSFETGTLPGGTFFNATNRPLIALFQNLRVRNLRVGGGTCEGPKAALPTFSEVEDLFAFARAVGNLRIIYSLRLHDGNLRDAAAMARFIWPRFQGQLECFALGNEPDWRSAQKQDNAITNYTSFLKQWSEFELAIHEAAPGAKFCGPDTGGDFDNGPPDSRNGAWANNGTEWTTRFAADARASGLVSLITQHEYLADVRPGKHRITQAKDLLEAMLSPGWDTVTNQTLYEGMAAPISALGYAYRLTEVEDCTGGLPGASDTFAGALWALDLLHWWAAHQCAGINFHNTRWRTNAVITINNNASRELTIYPKGYGLAAFDLGGHGREEPVLLSNASNLNLTAYATFNTSKLSVTIVNREHDAGARAAAATLILLGFRDGKVSAMSLAAAGGKITATRGITLGGVSITNNLPWQGQWSVLGAVTNGQFSLTVPASSAVILRVEQGKD